MRIWSRLKRYAKPAPAGNRSGIAVASIPAAIEAAALTSVSHCLNPEIQTGLKVRGERTKGRRMFVYQELLARAAQNKPVRVGLIGAGKFGSMFLSQVPTTPALQVSAIADLRPDAARKACAEVGWPESLIGNVAFTDDAIAMLARGDVDVVVEATGNPVVGLFHAREAIRQGKHIVMVNVEADVLAGALLAQEARAAGVVYSMAYGDQPALTCELVEWVRSCGFNVVAAGKGTKYLPRYHASTPDTVWDQLWTDRGPGS